MNELVLYNVRVISARGKASERQLVIIKDGLIERLAPEETLNDFHNSGSRLINCRDNTLVPGFIDAHCHLRALAESLISLDLGDRQIRSVKDIQDVIKKMVENHPSGCWIRGQNYHEFDLNEKRHPTRWDLDKVSSSHPVKLTHRSGHAHVLNSLALEQAGISESTADPPGGLIDREIPSGRLTGLLFEMGADLSNRIPYIADEELNIGMEKANRVLLTAGITSVQDASIGNGIDRLSLYHSCRDKSLFKPRINMMVGSENWRRMEKWLLRQNTEADLVQPGCVKIILDETTGHFHPSSSELREMVSRIHQSGLQVAIHAIEATAIEEACSAIEEALSQYPRNDHRHRVEHCSVCSEELSIRLASSGIAVVTQPAFIFYNGERYRATVSKNRQQHLYPIDTLMKNGVLVAGSSDFPVIPPDPLKGIYAAVARKTDQGKTFTDSQKISVINAIRLFTTQAAMVMFEEDRKGSIEPGKLADLVLLNADPTRIGVDDLADMRVIMTIIDGEVVWGGVD